MRRSSSPSSGSTREHPHSRVQPSANRSGCQPPGPNGVVATLAAMTATTVAVLRWSARPAERFVWTAVFLTAISLVPPLLSGADTATIIALIGPHLVAATVMIPTLARG